MSATRTVPRAAARALRSPNGPGRGEGQATARTAHFLAVRAVRMHLKAWSAVFAALLLTSLLLGSFALATLSAFAGHARVERYAATVAVVGGNQTTTYEATPFASKPKSVTAALTERVRVPESAVARLAAVPGVAAAIPDSAVPITLTAADGTTAVPGPDSESGVSPVYAHGWSTAALAPFTLRSGHQPNGPQEVVLDGALAARAGAKVGDEVGLQSPVGLPVHYRVAGIAAPRGGGDGTGLAHQGTVFLSDQKARDLAGHPGRVDAIGVLAEDGTTVHTLYPALRAALDGGTAAHDAVGERAPQDSSALRVLTGNARGNAEFLQAAPSRIGLLMLLATVCVVVTMIAVLVVSSTVAQAVHQRAREFALLRAVGATPRQLRVTVGRETAMVAITAALLGAAGAVPVYLELVAMLEQRGAIPVGLDLSMPPMMLASVVLTGALTLLVARVAAALACGRTAKLKPAAAMGEAQTEPEQPGKGRTITGVILLFAGVSAAGTASLQRGETAAAAASSAAMALVIACALLGPWIARLAIHLVGGTVRRLGGAGGYLADAATRANSRRLGAAITPIVLVVAFVGVQLSAGATLDREGGRQAGSSMRADLSVTAGGAGIPEEVVQRLARTNGVSAATGVLYSTIVLAHREVGDPKLDRFPVLGITPQALPATLDPKVTAGDLGTLGRGTVAVGTERARDLSLSVGSTVTIRYGDGAAVPLRVVALYERQLALGEFLFAHDELAAHTAAPANGRALLAVGPGSDHRAVRAAVERELAAAAPGATVTDQPSPEHLREEDRGVGQVITTVAVSAIGSFTVIAVLSTLALIVTGRRPELALLRLVGAGRRQVRGMLQVEALIVMTVGLVIGALAALIPLAAFSWSLAGSLPYLPGMQVALIVSTVVVTTLAGYLLPGRSFRRRRHPAELRRV
ncbi:MULTISPECIES: ABC transporter permease [unclassified Kitasatospora]|uniref:ABC transporter permease n=1 Tax=unclassified Kitasatospora TaxID=2633591 RepID=UPI0033CCBBA9